MAVKRSKSGSRILAVFEEVARRQPVGVSDLARAMQDDKSAVQRALMTLADAGWIAVAPGAPARWQPSPRILTLALQVGLADDLRQRARPVLEELRDRCGESVLLILFEEDGFVVAEAWESRQFLRTAPIVGMPISARNTSTGRAVLPYLPRERQAALLGGAPGPAEREAFAFTRAHGYSVSDGDVVAGATSIGAPLFDHAGLPVGAVSVSGPSDRIPPARHAEIGTMAAVAARRISLGEAGGG